MNTWPFSGDGRRRMRQGLFACSLIGSMIGQVWPETALVGAEARMAEREHGIRFQKTQLDPRFRSEGVAVADFNRDGRLDIAAGFVWYAAPDWSSHVISAQGTGQNEALLGTPPSYDPKGYSDSFINFASDLNFDGWVDLVVVGLPGQATWWFENPKGTESPWKPHLCTPVTNNESPQFLDLDGDGRIELIAGMSPDSGDPDGPDRRLASMRARTDPYALWAIHPISAKMSPGSRRFSHGLGVGDVNGDGLKDVLCAKGWWEAPSRTSSSEWRFHDAPFGERAAQMYVYDFDGDRDNDVLTSSPHNFGIWWHEQLAEDQWVTHEIDTSFSQTHALCLADIGGDGLLDFVTGKRWWAHGGKDPGADQPAVLYWFELKRREGRPFWLRHEIDEDSGVGTQFVVVDVDGDGRLDIVTSNKKGVFYFRQVRD